MKRIIAIIMVIMIALPSQAAFWNKKNKAMEAELEGKGYAGTLPDLNKKNSSAPEKKTASPVFEPQKEFNNPSDLKPVPKDNPAFIDIIQKHDKVSRYLNDANEIIPMLERLLDCIEDDGSVQLFVTRANVVSMNLDYLAQKYEGQPESSYESFKKLMDLNRYVKSIALLRKEALTYQRYLAYQASGSIYNPENISQQLEYLQQELTDAIILLREEE